MANLIDAIKSHNTDIALSLILYNDFDYTDNNGDTALICACEYNGVVDLLSCIAFDLIIYELNPLPLEMDNAKGIALS